MPLPTNEDNYVSCYDLLSYVKVRKSNFTNYMHKTFRALWGTLRVGKGISKETISFEIHSPSSEDCREENLTITLQKAEARELIKHLKLLIKSIK